MERNFNICIKLAELRTKIKNYAQPQVRNLNCQSPQVRMSATFFVSPQLRTCGLTSGLAQLCILLYPNVVVLPEVELRTQGSRPRPRPRTQKKSEAKAKDSLSEDRHSRGQGQECSRPRPRTKDTKRKCSPKKKKKKVFTKIFQAISKKKKKGLHKNFSSDLHEKTLSKKFFNRSTKF